MSYITKTVALEVGIWATNVTIDGASDAGGIDADGITLFAAGALPIRSIPVPQ